jgi:hypothetical protein
MIKFTTVVVMMSISGVANALDFTKVVHDADGEPLCFKYMGNNPSAECERPYTLAIAIRIAIDHPNNNPPTLDPNEKIRRGEIAQGLVGAKNIEVGTGFTESDRKTIRELVGRAFPPSIAASIAHMLDEDKAQNK